MQKLIFVYNANSGIGNTFIDVAHKIFSPKTYACNLCAITFDTFTENKLWKQFRENSTIEMEFLHSDEFKNKYNFKAFEYPVVFSKEKDTLVTFLSTKVINKIKSVDELIKVIQVQYNKTELDL